MSTTIRRSVDPYFFRTQQPLGVHRPAKAQTPVSSQNARVLVDRYAHQQTSSALAARKLSGRDLRVVHERSSARPRVFSQRQRAASHSQVRSETPSTILHQLKSALTRGAALPECFRLFLRLPREVQFRCYELLFKERITEDGIEQFLANPKVLLPILDQFGTAGSSLKRLLEEEHVDLTEAFTAFMRLHPDQQMRCYELLCRDLIIREGVDKFLENPSALLQRIRANGRTLPIIDHLLTAAEGAPRSTPARPMTGIVATRARTSAVAARAAPRTAARTRTSARTAPTRQVVARTSVQRTMHTDVAPYVRQSWETGVESRSREQICASLDELMRSWHVNRLERTERRAKRETVSPEPTPEERKAHLRMLNKQIFLHMKRNHGVETPMEFLWSLQEYHLQEPLRICVRPRTFIPEEGQFYKPDPFSEDCPLRKPGELGDAVEGYSYFGCAVKRTGNKLYLYLDGISQGQYLLINGQMYPYAGLDRRGNSRPSYLLKEGDIVCEGGVVSKYLFTVGPDGTIIYPANERQYFNDEEVETDQASSFVRDLTSDTDGHFRFTSKTQHVAEITDRIEPGFSFRSTIQLRKSGSRMSDEGDRIFIDIHNDPILRSLVHYLREEFRVMRYTNAQKMVRIAHLAADLLSEEPRSYNMKYNYLLGEVLKAGCGVCRHRATLAKVMADALDVPCTLVMGSVGMPVPFYGSDNQFVGFIEVIDWAGHAWNVMEVDGRNYIVDPMHECIFGAGDPPGDSTEHRRRITEWYGAERL